MQKPINLHIPRRTNKLSHKLREFLHSSVDSRLVADKVDIDTSLLVSSNKGWRVNCDSGVFRGECLGVGTTVDIGEELARKSDGTGEGIFMNVLGVGTLRRELMSVKKKSVTIYLHDSL